MSAKTKMSRYDILSEYFRLQRKYSKKTNVFELLIEQRFENYDAWTDDEIEDLLVDYINWCYDKYGECE
ncbi:MAG: hypothetical protein ACOCRK_03490 [bacterium]